MFQQTMIVGNLGKDPEMRYTPSGQAVTSFSVATSNQYTNTAGEKIKETTWFRVSAWGKQAEVCNQYLHKGSKVMVTGRLSSDKETGGPRVWTAQDGTPKANYELTSERVVFLSPASDGQGQREQNPGGYENQGYEDDIPF